MMGRIRYFLIKKLSKFLINAIILTCRKKTETLTDIQKLREKGSVIYIFWHRHIFYVIHKFKNTGAQPLISLSKDGELVSHVGKEFGLIPIRGSSSKGGVKAFLTLVKTIKENKSSQILITADGPKGPAKKIKEGIILLSLKTKVPIIPIAWTSTKTKIFQKTWDKFMIPLPFSTITFYYGEPIYIPKDLKKNKIRDLKKNIEDLLNDLGKTTP